MTDKIEGDGGKISWSDKKMYEQEYKHAADLFQRSLDQYSKSDNIFQKDAFKKVMDEALTVMNQTAGELKRNELLKQNSEIEQDYNTFQQDDSETKKLQSDLAKAKRSI